MADDIYEKLKLFNAFIKERAQGQVSALALKKEHMAHIKEALNRGHITGEQYDELMSELELIGGKEAKKCPRCDTVLRENAKMCFKCGFSFEELVPPSEKTEPFFKVPIPEPKPAFKPASSKSYLVIGIVAALLILSLGVFAALLVRGVIPTFDILKSKISTPQTLPPYTLPPQTLPPETAPPQTMPPPIVAISKIQAIATDPSKEYIEIYNTTNTTLDVTGWTISDNQNHIFKFGRFFLQPGRKVRIHTGAGSNTLVDLYWVLTTFVWDDGGDTITIRDASGNILVQVSY